MTKKTFLALNAKAHPRPCFLRQFRGPEAPGSTDGVNEVGRVQSRAGGPRGSSGSPTAGTAAPQLHPSRLWKSGPGVDKALIFFKRHQKYGYFFVPFLYL